MKTILSVVLVGLIGIVLILAGCKSTKEGNGEQAGDAGTVATVNNVCPIKTKAFDPVTVAAKLVVQFEGKKVGFCCSNCVEAWAKLTDEEKKAKLSAVLKEAPAATKGGS